MASIRSAFLMIVIVMIKFHHAESQFSVLATNQVQIIRLLEEITTTSTPLVPNITALLTNQEALLENTTTVLNEINNGQGHLIKLMEETASSKANHESLLQNNTAVLNEMNSAIHQIADTQTRMATSLEQIVTLLQTKQSEDVQVIPTDCSNISTADNHGSGVYTIDPRDGQGSFDVYCNMETDDRGWTVFQKRFNGSVDFFLNWTDYENGFGNLNGEHWLGLQKMHRLTSCGRWTLRMGMEDFNGNVGYAQYEDFKIGDAASFYRLSLGSFTGNIQDSLTYHNGQPFSTKDQDQSGYCAPQFQGAWWYENCFKSNLNGLYQGSSSVPNYPSSLMCWNEFDRLAGCTTIKKSEMKIHKIQ